MCAAQLDRSHVLRMTWHQARMHAPPAASSMVCVAAVGSPAVAHGMPSRAHASHACTPSPLCAVCLPFPAATLLGEVRAGNAAHMTFGAKAEEEGAEGARGLVPPCRGGSGAGMATRRGREGEGGHGSLAWFSLAPVRYGSNLPRGREWNPELTIVWAGRHAARSAQGSQPACAQGPTAAWLFLVPDP